MTTPTENKRIISQHTLHGMTFEAIRFKAPLPHWRLKTPTGEILEPGAAGLDSSSRPKLFASLDYLAERVGKDRFLREFDRDPS